MDYYPSKDYDQGRRWQRNVGELRKEHAPDINRELACLAHLATVGDESARRGVEDGLRRLHALDSRLFTPAQRRQVEALQSLLAPHKA